MTDNQFQFIAETFPALLGTVMYTARKWASARKENNFMLEQCCDWWFMGAAFALIDTKVLSEAIQYMEKAKELAVLEVSNESNSERMS